MSFVSIARTVLGEAIIQGTSLIATIGEALRGEGGGAYDDEHPMRSASAAATDDAPMFNIDGTPMCGGVDAHGNAYGFTSSPTPDVDFGCGMDDATGMDMDFGGTNMDFDSGSGSGMND